MEQERISYGGQHVEPLEYHMYSSAEQTEQVGIPYSGEHVEILRNIIIGDVEHLEQVRNI
jgi:hypothetical protein